MHSKASCCLLICLISTYDLSGSFLFFTRVSHEYCHHAGIAHSPFALQNLSASLFGHLDQHPLIWTLISLVWEFTPCWLCASFTVTLKVFTTPVLKYIRCSPNKLNRCRFRRILLIHIWNIKTTVCSLVTSIQEYQSFCSYLDSLTKKKKKSHYSHTSFVSKSHVNQRHGDEFSP